MKIHSLFSYPLHSHSLMFIAVFSLLIPGSIFGTVLLNAWSLMGLVLFSLYALKYGYMVLDYTVNGHKEPPVLSFERINVFSDTRPLKQGLILSVFIGPGMIIHAAWGSLAGMFYWLLLAGIIPACTIILAIDNDVFKALYPPAWFSFIARLRLAYLAIYIPLAISAGIIALMVHYHLDIVMTIYGIVPAVAIILYLLVWDFHVTGIILYNHRFELGLQVDHSPERKEETRQQAMQKRVLKVLDHVYTLRRAGKKQDALAYLIANTKNEPNQKQLHAWLHEEFRHWDNPTMLLLHGEYYICQLITAADLHTAMEVWQTCHHYDAHFCPHDEALHWQLTRYALDLNRRREALQLLMKLLAYASKPAVRHAAATMAQDLCQQGFADAHTQQVLQQHIAAISRQTVPSRPRHSH